VETSGRGRVARLPVVPVDFENRAVLIGHLLRPQASLRAADIANTRYVGTPFSALDETLQVMRRQSLAAIRKG